VGKILCFFVSFSCWHTRAFREGDELRRILSRPRIAEVIEITFCFRGYQEHEHYIHVGFGGCYVSP
jgi:hypothetical protein